MRQKLFTLSRYGREDMWCRFKQADDHRVAERLHAILLLDSGQNADAVSPGSIRTEMWTSMPEAAREATFQALGQSLSVGRVGEAHDLAQAYVYLMREGFSTGQVIIVDGGTTLV